MGPDLLIEHIYAGRLDEVVQLLRPLSDSDRSKLSKPVSDCYRGLDDLTYHHKQNSELAKVAKSRLMPPGILEDQFQGRRNRALEAAEVALIGCCPLSKIRASNISLRIGNENSRDRNRRTQVVDVLSHRAPEFNDSLINYLIQANSDDWRRLDWRTLEQLRLAGACSKPSDPDYLMLLTESIGHDYMYSSRKQKGRQFMEDVAKIPDLVESDVYRIFEYDTDAFAYDWTGWGKLILFFIEQNLVERSRIFQCAMAGLTNPFRQNTLGGIVKFIESLEPGTEDWTENLDTLFELLRNPTSSILNFALKKLKLVSKSEQIAAQRWIEELAVVFQSPTKGSAKSALALVQQLAKKNPELVPYAIETTLTAFDHPEVDIHEKAMVNLEKWAERAHPDHATVLREKIEYLPASLKNQAEDLANKIAADRVAGTQESQPAQGPVPAGSSPSSENLKEEVKGVVEPWRKTAGIDSVLDCLETDSYPMPLSYSISDVPVLSSFEEILPIETYEELIDEIAKTLEEVVDPMDAERVLDGLVRLGRIPEEFSERVQPIAKRIQKIPTTETAKGLTSSVDSAHLLEFFEWYFDLPQAPKGQDFEYRFPCFIVQGGFCPWYKFRVDEVWQLTREAKAPGLLSLPTHERGWIEPTAFSRRLIQYIESNATVGEQDFVLALQRLTPEGRLKAAALLEPYPSKWSTIAQMALGSDLDSLDLSHCSVEWTSAAAAIRVQPVGDEVGKRLGLSRRIAHGDPPVWIANWEERQLATKDLHLAMTKPFDTNAVLKPLMELVFSEQATPTFSTWRTAMNLTVSKHWDANFILVGVRRMVEMLDNNSAACYPLHAFFEVYFEPDRCWAEPHHLLLALGSLAKNQDVRYQVIDALVEGVQEGKVDPVLFGKNAATIIRSKLGVVKRMGDLLLEVARNSSLHQWFVVLALEATLAGFDGLEKLPRGSDTLLQAYHNGLVELQLEPGGHVKSLLAPLKGASKTTKVAKKVLACTASPSSKRQEAIGCALSARRDRALRWAGDRACVD